MCFVDESEEKEILSHMPHCISARWHPTFCDISPIGGTKQLGIDKFLEYYGLDLKDFVTKDVDDEGIAYALKHYGLIDL